MRQNQNPNVTLIREVRTALRTMEKALKAFEKEAAAKDKVLEKVASIVGTLKAASTPTNRRGRAKPDWTSHAMNFLNREIKAETLHAKLTQLGYKINPKTLHAFLRRQLQAGHVERIARGFYKAVPLETKRPRKRGTVK